MVRIGCRRLYCIVDYRNSRRLQYITISYRTWSEPSNVLTFRRDRRPGLAMWRPCGPTNGVYQLIPPWRLQTTLIIIAVPMHMVQRLFSLRCSAIQPQPTCLCYCRQGQRCRFSLTLSGTKSRFYEIDGVPHLQGEMAFEKQRSRITFSHLYRG